ncbi:limonene-1,2-epoxide hydrolase family protein [Williamsia sp. M5A3_1d]
MSVSAHHCLLWSAEDVAVRFLESLAVGDAEIAEHLLAPDVDYRCGFLWSRQGRSDVTRMLNRMVGASRGFDVAIASIDLEPGGDETTGDRIDVVRTVRTDHVVYGRVRVQLSVRGRAEIRAGKIVAWHDDVDRWHLATAMLRGLCGAVVPSMRPHLPPH